MIRTLIVNILLRMLGRHHYSPLSKNEVKTLLIRLSNEEEVGRLQDFLEQCSDLYRNQFLYTKDERFRGAVLAFSALKERIKQAKAENLTKTKKSGKIKQTY